MWRYHLMLLSTMLHKTLTLSTLEDCNLNCCLSDLIQKVTTACTLSGRYVPLRRYYDRYWETDIGKTYPTSNLNHQRSPSPASTSCPVLLFGGWRGVWLIFVVAFASRLWYNKIMSEPGNDSFEHNMTLFRKLLGTLTWLQLFGKSLSFLSCLVHWRMQFMHIP